MTNFFDILEKNHKEAIQEINHMIDVDAQEFDSYKEAATLCKFIFEYENNMYGLLQNPETFRGFYDNAQDFAMLCKSIYHAICDDGEIAYTKYDYNHPTILFKCRWEITAKDFSNPDTEAIDDYIKKFRKREGLKPSPDPVIIFYNNAYEFIQAVKEYDIDYEERGKNVQKLLAKIKKENK